MATNGAELEKVSVEIQDVHDDGSKELDAGLRPLDHYKQVRFLKNFKNSPKQRLGYKFPLRQSVLPLVRWETPYLAEFQVNFL